MIACMLRKRLRSSRRSSILRPGGGAEVLEHLWPLGHFQHYENSITVRLYQFLITAVDIDVDLSTARLVCMAPTP